MVKGIENFGTIREGLLGVIFNLPLDGGESYLTDRGDWYITFEIPNPADWGSQLQVSNEVLGGVDESYSVIGHIRLSNRGAILKIFLNASIVSNIHNTLINQQIPPYLVATISSAALHKILSGQSAITTLNNVEGLLYNPLLKQQPFLNWQDSPLN